MLRAKVDAFHLVEARVAGVTTETPERLTPPSSIPVKRVSDMRARWVELFDPGQKQIDDNKLYVDRFIKMFGDLPVPEITRLMIRQFRDAVAT